MTGQADWNGDSLSSTLSHTGAGTSCPRSVLPRSATAKQLANACADLGRRMNVRGCCTRVFPGPVAVKPYSPNAKLPGGLDVVIITARDVDPISRICTGYLRKGPEVSQRRFV